MKITMASSSEKYSNGFKLAATVVLLTCLTFLSPISVVGLELEQSEMMIGSRPPGCINRCRSCRPCMATLVIPPHDNKGLGEASHREDDSYYLLSWKCKCGNKLYQP